MAGTYDDVVVVHFIVQLVVRIKFSSMLGLFMGCLSFIYSDLKWRLKKNCVERILKLLQKSG